jgi:hypothetical protein
VSASMLTVRDRPLLVVPSMRCPPMSKRIFHGKIPAPIRRTRQTRERLAVKRQAQQPAPKGRAAASVAGVSTSREWRPRRGRRLNLAALGHWRPVSLALGPPVPPPDLGQDRRQGLEF